MDIPLAASSPSASTRRCHKVAAWLALSRSQSLWLFSFAVTVAMVTVLQLGSDAHSSDQREDCRRQVVKVNQPEGPNPHRPPRATDNTNSSALEQCQRRRKEVGQSQQTEELVALLDMTRCETVTLETLPQT